MWAEGDALAVITKEARENLSSETVKTDTADQLKTSAVGVAHSSGDHAAAQVSGSVTSGLCGFRWFVQGLENVECA